MWIDLDLRNIRAGTFSKSVAIATKRGETIYLTEPMISAGSLTLRVCNYEFESSSLKPEFVAPMWSYRSRMHNQLTMVTFGKNLNIELQQFSYVKASKFNKTLPYVNWKWNIFQRKWKMKNIISIKKSSVSICTKITWNQVKH